MVKAGARTSADEARRTPHLGILRRTIEAGSVRRRIAQVQPQRPASNPNALITRRSTPTLARAGFALPLQAVARKCGLTQRYLSWSRL